MDDKHLNKLISIESKLITMCELVERHDKDLYRGNGKAGILTRLAVSEEDIDGLNKGHESQKIKIKDAIDKLSELNLNWSINWTKITMVAAIASLIISPIMIYIAEKVFK